MNIEKLLAPDFAFGKLLCLARAVVDALILLLRSPSKQSFKCILLAFRVIPGYTMVSIPRLINLYNLIREVNKRNIEGDIVECGVWNGGSSVIMGAALHENKSKRQERNMWLFDSFQGVPHPGEKDGKREKKDFFKGWNKGDINKVKKIFNKLKMPLDKVNIIPGWFNETLRNTNIDRISLLHIDADWYDSIKEALNTLYNKVTPGGFIVFDDYFRWEGCQRAVQDFFQEYNINNITIVKVDKHAAYFQKPE